LSAARGGRRIGDGPVPDRSLLHARGNIPADQSDDRRAACRLPIRLHQSDMDVGHTGLLSLADRALAAAAGTWAGRHRLALAPVATGDADRRCRRTWLRTRWRTYPDLDLRAADSAIRSRPGACARAGVAGIDVVGGGAAAVVDLCRHRRRRC